MAENETKQSKYLVEDFEVFDARDILNASTYGLMSVLGIMANSLVLFIAGRQSNRQDTRSWTNVHFLVFHLTIADSVTCSITLPMETVWRATVEWYAGNMVCKVLMMIRTGGFILSSNMLVVLSIDRAISISKPLFSLNVERQRGRARLMVITAWVLTIFFTIPQAIIFRVMKHPEKNFYQCTTINFFEDLCSEVKVGNHTEKLLLGLTPVVWADIYHTIFNCQVFFVPLIAIVASYTQIYFILRRRNNALNVLLDSGCDDEAMTRSNHKKMSTMKALKMSVVHVVTFVICWTPYTIMATWDTVDKQSARRVPGVAQDILYLTAVFNSCLNPFIYGVYYYSERRTRRQDSKELQITRSNLGEEVEETCETSA